MEWKISELNVWPRNFHRNSYRPQWCVYTYFSLLCIKESFWFEHLYLSIYLDLQHNISSPVYTPRCVRQQEHLLSATNNIIYSHYYFKSNNCSQQTRWNKLLLTVIRGEKNKKKSNWKLLLLCESPFAYCIIPNKTYGKNKT